jgi:O-antigen/teichoic acid export membrane protein
LTRGTAKLAAAQIGGQIIGFALLAVVSRRLGPSYIGAYQFDAQIVSWFGLAAVLGIPVLASRDIATSRGAYGAVFSETVVLRLALALVAFAAVLLLSRVLVPDRAARSLLPIVAAMLLVNALGFEWALVGLQRQGTVAASRFLGQVAYGAVMPFLLARGLQGARYYAAVNVLGVAVANLVVVYGLRHRLHFHWPSRSALVRRLRVSAPFAWSLLMIQVYYTIDFLMLEYVKNAREVGLYGIAYRVPLAVITFAGLWVTAFYPAVAKAVATDRKPLTRQLSQATTMACVLGVSVVLAAPIAGRTMQEMFGNAYGGAGPSFAILMLTAGVILVSVTVGNTLLAVGDEKRYAVGVSIGAITNVALNCAAIPVLGSLGAAISTLAAELAVLAYMVRRYRQVVGPLTLDFRRLQAALGAALLGLVVVVLLSRVGPALVAGGLGVVTYFALAVLFGAVSRRELAFWRSQ